MNAPTIYTPEQIRAHAHLLTCLAASRSLDDTEKAGEMLLQMLAGEEGAAEAFGVVVQDKRDLEAEVARLQHLLEGAHRIIRERVKPDVKL